MNKKLLILFFAIFSASAFGAQAVVDENSATDYDISEIKLYPSAPIINQKSRIVVKLRNSGSNTITTSEGVNSKAEDFPDFVIEKTTLPLVGSAVPLVPGATVDYVYEGYFKASGTKKLSFSVDISDNIREKIETNNTRTLDLPVYAADESNLYVAKLSPSKLDPLVNEKITIAIEIGNKGRNVLTDNKGMMLENSGTVPMIVRDVDYLFEDFVVSGMTMDAYPSLDKPMSGNFKVNYEGYFNKAGSKRIEYTANVNKRLVEKDYNNNRATTSLVAYSTTEERDDFRVYELKTVVKSSTSIDVSWKTDKKLATSFRYHLSTDSEIKKSATSENYSHSISLTGLEPLGRYLFDIFGTLNGNEKKAETGEFVLPKEVSITTATTSTTSTQPTQTNTSNETPNTDTNSGSQQQNVPAPTTVTSTTSVEPIVIKDAKLYASLKGRIILRVEKSGEAYYVSPSKQEMYYLGRPEDAFAVMRRQGIGISTANLGRITIAVPDKANGADQDADGLSDLFEDAVGSSKSMADGDGDGYSDKAELSGGFDPAKSGRARLPFDAEYSQSQAGKIFLASEMHGEAWYVAKEGKRHFLGRAADAFAVMRMLGVGVSEESFGKL